jgi:N-acetylglucosamine-6-sulfatase
VEARHVTSVLAALAVLMLPTAAQARPVAASTDGRPNILVVMTDDQAKADVSKMPNVRRLLAARGTSFADAIDSFPLCCPARATFITGQYAHNHGVAGNFWPYGWYGMKHRGNILPAWLQKAGYRTALIGKWLNGYGALDAHGEVPKGFDVWRGLLDSSSYDYYNFVMNRDGRLRTWGDADFARKLVEFAKIEVVRNDAGLAGIFGRLTEVFGPAPYGYFGAENPKDYSPDVTGRIAERLVRKERKSNRPFFIWWAPVAPHREDVATTLMKREGRDPRPAPRYEASSSRYELPRPPGFNERDFADKPSRLRDTARLLTDAEIEQLQLDYEGRIGSLLAVDDHVKRLLRILRATRQLKNTLIVFLSDNGWLQGEHRIPGDKFLAYEESLRVPLILRGPGVPAGRTVRGQVSNIDLAPTLLDVARARAGRTLDGVSLMAAVRDPSKRPRRALQVEALAPLFRHDLPVNRWDRPYTGVRTDRYTYVVYTETGDRELYDRRRDPHQLRNVAADPAYAKARSRLAAKLAKLDGCRGRSCNVRP